MDTYTKQVDCPEIQGLWKEPKAGDRYWDIGLSRVDCVDGTLEDDGGGYSPRKVWKEYTWLPRQEDWQNILFRLHYAPALPKSVKVIQAALIHMHQEFVDYMESWKIDQPCEAWARMFMNFHNKRWTEEGWV